MDIQAEKINIIKQFKQINDIDLIHAIKSLLDYARNKEQSDSDRDVSENQKQIVRGRIKKYEDSPESYLTWHEIEHEIISKK